ncbi:hypothetical protein N7532_002392 [Penicillium argentinense]|uniref:tyrosine--tRNA ligase n=1 Tax=Penicillium argentinense TaxID=1131581 RepID=A0A9W9G1V8_9EURO|nr:uncharacterized protein N7532_002392 [Penicillium argentinense]KAJ5109747.1 hypothetical protein N7532_002392 [Penicillium argentinense]
MTIDKNYELIARGVDVQDAQIIKHKLDNGDLVKGFWGTAPTGKPHIGYLLPCIKLMEFVAAGVETCVYFADTYAFLINHDVSAERVGYRTRYYQFLLSAILDSLGVPKSKVSFVTESERFTYDPAFISKEHQLCVLVSQDAIRACGNEIDETNALSPMMCPGRQALAEAFLGVHFQLGGEDQRGMFNFANTFLPQLGFDKAAHLINPLLPALSGAKMSSSKAASSKIEFLDTADDVTSKILTCHFDEENVDSNGLLAIAKMVIFPFTRIANSTGKPWEFSCELADGRNKEYISYEELVRDLKEGTVGAKCIKVAVASTLNRLLEPIRQAFASSKEWQEIADLAYPS